MENKPSVRDILFESQVQCDEDGVMIQVSRQALTEFIGEFDALQAKLSAQSLVVERMREALPRLKEAEE